MKEEDKDKLADIKIKNSFFINRPLTDKEISQIQKLFMSKKDDKRAIRILTWSIGIWILAMIIYVALI